MLSGHIFLFTQRRLIAIHPIWSFIVTAMEVVRIEEFLNFNSFKLVFSLFRGQSSHELSQLSHLHHILSCFSRIISIYLWFQAAPIPLLYGSLIHFCVHVPSVFNGTWVSEYNITSLIASTDNCGRFAPPSMAFVCFCQHTEEFFYYKKLANFQYVSVYPDSCTHACYGIIPKNSSSLPGGGGLLQNYERFKRAVYCSGGLFLLSVPAMSQWC